MKQLFVVWVRDELAAFEIISFLTSAGRWVFCIVIDDAFSPARCESYANRDGPLASTLMQHEVRYWSNFGSAQPECSAVSDANDPKPTLGNPVTQSPRRRSRAASAEL
jgi:hypothetical protein